ncbi:HD domain-containing protein [Shigella flexneri]
MDKSLHVGMDIDTLRAAMLFPLADANVVSEDILRVERGQIHCSLIDGVCDRRRYASLKPRIPIQSLRSRSITSAGRCWQVDDFRRVVIKLAERIAHLREARTRRKTNVFWWQVVDQIYAPLANRLGIGN